MLKKNAILLLSIHMFIYLLISLSIFSSLTSWVRADNTPISSFQITPSTLEINIKPGSQKKLNFEITNYLEKPLILTIRLASFQNSPDNSSPVFNYKNGTINQLLLTDNKFSPWQITLDPLEIKDFSPTLILPRNLKTGDYYLALIFENLIKDTNPSNFKLHQKLQIASLIFLTIKDKPLPVKGSLSEFKTTAKIFFTPQVNFHIIFFNEGRARTKINPVLEISSLFGNRREVILFPSLTVLADEEKNLAPYTDKLPFKPQSVIGIYQAKITINSPSQKTPLVRNQTWFVYISTPLIILFILLLLTLVVSYYIYHQYK